MRRDLPPLPDRDDRGLLPAFAWPGGYALVYYTRDWGIMCAACANGANGSRCQDPDLDPTCPDDQQWSLLTCDVRWEGPTEQCTHCNVDMPSEYGDPDAPEGEADHAH